MELLFPLPQTVQTAIKTLEKSGYEAFIVGGCVRDTLLNRPIHDWDITTSALPEEIQSVFSGYSVIPTGIKHGTVTVFIEGLPLEITTYRTDGTYSDNRHPDFVHFTKDLRQDLSRRDFKINAMAYSPTAGLIDPFDGQKDLKNQVLSCVGLAKERFEEDALRILRALRFSAQLSFSIEAATAQAIFEKATSLKQISPERIQQEFVKLLCGKNADTILRDYADIFTQFIPELKPCIGFDQKSKYHIYDVWEHSIHTVRQIQPKPILRLAALFHDIGKPSTFSLDEEGYGHFYGHQKRGAEITRPILKRLKFDNETIQTVTTLVEFHDVTVTDSLKVVRKWLNKLGEERFRQLLLLNRADTLSHAKTALPRLYILENEEKVFKNIIVQNLCFSVKTLAVNGKDLIALGVPQGEQVGHLLNQLLEVVMEEQCLNEKEPLLRFALELIHHAE